MSVRIVFTRHITVSKQNRMLFVLLPVYAFLCGFVFIEPSPAELFFLVSAPLLLFHLRFAGEKLLLFLLFGISTMVSLVIGLMNGLVNERYFIIDIYLFTLFFIFSSVKISRKAFHRLFRIMIIAWTLACLGNFLFYFYAIFTGRTVLFGTQIAAFGIRFKGLFKDPNVLGPFMIVPATYWLNEFLSKSQYRKLTFFTGLIMSLGVILSFSRAAWISYFAVLSLVVLTAFKSSKSWLRVLLLIFLFVLLFNFLARADLSILGYDLRIFFTQRLGLQSYDSDRFASQRGFIEMLRSNPLFGIGPGNYEFYTHYAAHSTLTRLLGERGLIGFFVFTIVFLLGMKRAYEKDKFLSFLLLGILLNSIFVDTFHWRHLWLLLAFSFMGIDEKIGLKDCQTKRILTYIET